jgi:hypothetical protein
MPVTTVSMPARGAIAPIHRYRPPTTITFRPVEDVSPGHEPTDLVTPEPEGLSTGAEPTDLVTPEPEGLSTGAKVAIGVAAAAVVGLSGWAIYRVSKRTRRGRR